MKESGYLLEIGTEELPVDFLETVELELQQKMVEALAKNNFECDDKNIRVFITPRRLAIVVPGIRQLEQSSEETVKGPPVSAAYDANGNPTQAALGFAKKMGFSHTDLGRASYDGIEYLTCLKKLSVKTLEEVIALVVPDVVLSLSGSHFMAWDESGIKFSRPIRWILSLLDDRHVPVSIGLTQSTNITRGHRFFSNPSEFPINTIDSYKDQLQHIGSVCVDHRERRVLINQALQKKARELGGTVPPNEPLLNMVTMLVECPVIIAGNFADRFLKLPEEVITTVMAAHQKYFPVKDALDRLYPHFITISNNPDKSAAETIRKGNEKVLRARLEDASFFYQEDTRHPLEYYVDKLKGITFQKGMGTLYDKAKRLQALGCVIGQSLKDGLELTDDDLENASRAAILCKADLATNLVRELTELQGIIGKYYAESSGEKPAVSKAIAEHYLPRFMGDYIAKSPAGIIISLADKLDTLVTVFAQKDARYPTGSKDPMGLRRMSLGIIQTVLENRLGLNLNEVLCNTWKNLGSLAVEPESKTVERTVGFLLQRLKGYMLEQNYSYDAIDAILESDTHPLTDLINTMERLAILKELRQKQDEFKRVYEPANRTARILGKDYIADITAGMINPDLFETSFEKDLFNTLADLHTESLSCMLDRFLERSAIVESFFDNVLVNVDNQAVKGNRFRLLSLLNQSYRQFADFTKLVV